MTSVTEDYTETTTYTRTLYLVCDRCGEVIERGPEFELSFREKGWAVEDLCRSCVDYLYDLLILNNFKMTATGR